MARLSKGPFFGAGADLCINDASKEKSYARFGRTYKPPFGYTYPSKKCTTLLTGTSFFTPNEVEVYYLS